MKKKEKKRKKWRQKTWNVYCRGNNGEELPLSWNFHCHFLDKNTKRSHSPKTCKKKKKQKYIYKKKESKLFSNSHRTWSANNNRGLGWWARKRGENGGKSLAIRLPKSVCKVRARQKSRTPKETQSYWMESNRKPRKKKTKKTAIQTVWFRTQNWTQETSKKKKNNNKTKANQ